MALNRSKILASADKYISQQKYEKALNELLKLVQSSPNDTNLLNKIGDLYSQTGNGPSAIPYFEKVAESYRKGGFYPKTIALYKKIIRIDGNHMETREKLVDLFVQQGHLSEAKAELRGMAQHYLEGNLPARALNSLERIVSIDPGNLDARIKLTEILIREGKNQEASVHFLQMGEDLLEKNMVQEAKKILSQATKFDENNPKIQTLMAKTLIAEGKVDEAIQFLTEVCEKNPRDKASVLALGRAYLSQNKLPEACTCFLRANHIDHSEIRDLEEVAKLLIETEQLDHAFDAYAPVADYLLAKDEVEEATRLFRSILYADERHSKSLQRLIEIYKKTNQTPNAILTYEKLVNFSLEDGDNASAESYVNQILELDPDNLEWRSKLDSIRGGDNQPVMKATPKPEPVEIPSETDSSALLSFDGSVDMSMEPDDPDTLIRNHLTEAEVFVKYGIIDQALSHLMSIIEIDPQHLEANQKLKQIYLDRGETDKAIACLTNMASIAMQQGNLGDAEEILGEAEELKPGVSRIYRGQLEALRHKDRQHDPLYEDADEGFDLEIEGPGEVEVIDGHNLAEESSQLHIGDVDQGEIMDFASLGQDAVDGEWSLDGGPAEPEASLELDFSVPDHAILSEEIQLDESLNLEDDEEDHDPADQTEMLEDSLEEPSIQSFDLDSEELDLADEVELDEPAFDSGSIEVDEFDHLELGADSEEDVASAFEKDMEQVVPPPLDVIADPTEIEPKLPEPDLEVEQTPEPEVKKEPEPDLEGLQDDLEEIEFFISMDAQDDARNLLQESLKKFGRIPALVDLEKQILLEDEPKTEIVEPKVEEPSASSGSIFESDGTGFFDLATELQGELIEGDFGEVTDNAPQEEFQSVEELFEEFKKGVEEQIDDDDFETHYDLGIAYKEMGLVEESINEFKKALGDGKRYLECIAMIGSCLIELGRSEEAVHLYEEAMAKPDYTQKDLLPLKYECGLANEGLGEVDRALELFKEIQAINANYRDVEKRIASLV